MPYSDNPLLLTVCRQDFRKDIPCLLHAYVILQHQGIRFNAVIAGGGQELNRNRHIAHKLQLNHITFTGFIGDASPLLTRSYAFVLPSLEEGGGSIAVLEAMAAGLPIVATNVDGIPEDVEDGVSGILVQPGNSYALANALETLLKDPNHAKQLGNNAHKHFLEKYNSKTIRSSLRRLLITHETF